MPHSPPPSATLEGRTRALRPRQTEGPTGGQKSQASREEEPAEQEVALQRQAFEGFQGGHGLRNEEGRRKAWTSFSGGGL